MTQDDKAPEPLHDFLVRLTEFAFQFSRVERITRHPDGVRPETDSDHTVMLALTALTVAHEVSGVDGMPALDTGKVALYALAHDLVEAYAGDTPTYRVTAEERQAKADREEAAFGRIGYGFAQYGGWMVRAIIEYEAQDAPEARFVYLMDKLAPKITHVLNGGVTIRAEGDDPSDLQVRLHEQRVVLTTCYPEFLPLLRRVFDPLAKRAVGACADAESRRQHDLRVLGLADADGGGTEGDDTEPDNDPERLLGSMRCDGQSMWSSTPAPRWFVRAVCGGDVGEE